MKVLFISHHRERSGWGAAARGYIRAMQAAGIEVAARPILMGGPKAELDQDILDAEEVSSYGAQHCIQHVLPRYMEYSGGFDKCVGMVAIDSFDIGYSGWLENLRLMDEVWTFNKEAAKYLKTELNSVSVIPHAFDTTIFEKDHGIVQLPLPDGMVKFYTIIDNMNRRKNLPAIIKAFHLAFPADYPVALIIKATQHGASEEEIFEEVNKTTSSIKEGLRLYRSVDDYHKEVVISQELPDTQMYALHQTCDVYVSASYAEGFCIPAFEAMGFGNTVIASNTGGPRDYLGKGHHLVSGRYERIFGMMNAPDGLFTAHESWFNIDIEELANAMKSSYQKRQADRHVEGHSYKRVGQKIKRRLNT